MLEDRTKRAIHRKIKRTRQTITKRGENKAER